MIRGSVRDWGKRGAIRKDWTIGNHYSCVTFLRADGQHRKKEGKTTRYGYNDKDRLTRRLSLLRVEDLESLGGKLSSTPLNPRKPRKVDVESFSRILRLPFPNLVVSMPHRRLTAHLCTHVCATPSTTCPVGACLCHTEPGHSYMGCCCTLYERRHAHQVSLPRISSLRNETRYVDGD